MNTISKFFVAVARWFSVTKRRRRLLLVDDEFDRWLGV